MAFFSMLRKFLDGLYTAGGVFAAFWLIVILVLIVIQMIARWTGEVFSGAPAYAGYCMAAASFFAFAYALNYGSHIRVSILLNALGPKRWWAELWCFVLGSVVSTYVAFYAIKTTYWSHYLNDISQELDATPMWIPHLCMSIGSVLLAVCFWDNLCRLIFTGDHGIKSNAISNEGAE